MYKHNNDEKIFKKGLEIFMYQENLVANLPNMRTIIDDILQKRQVEDLISNSENDDAHIQFELRVVTISVGSVKSCSPLLTSPL